MPLINCPDCGRGVSDSAPTCPGCGRPIAGALSPQTPQPETKDSKGFIIAMSIVLGLFALLLLVGGVAAVGNSIRETERAPDTQRFTAQPSPVAGHAEDPRLEIVRFLQGVRDKYEAAEKACFRAMQCGDVEETRARWVRSHPSLGESGFAAFARVHVELGGVLAVSEVAPCARTRIIDCNMALSLLKLESAPQSIADAWSSKVASIEYNQSEAEKTLRIAESANLPASLATPEWAGNRTVTIWAESKGLLPANPEHDPNADLTKTPQMLAGKAAEESILAQIPGVCRDGVYCTVGKVMGGAPLYMQNEFMREVLFPGTR